jgi:hypothetical protein
MPLAVMHGTEAGQSCAAVNACVRTAARGPAPRVRVGERWLATPSGSLVGRRECRANPRPEEREPLNGLVAEHEADMAVGDLAAPAAHRGGGDLLLEQAVGDLDTVEFERGDVEKK